MKMPGFEQTFHSKIHKLSAIFQDHCFQNSKTKLDKLVIHSFSIHHMIHVNSLLHSSNDKVLPFQSYNLHQSKCEAIQLMIFKVRELLAFQFDRRTQNTQTFNNLS